MGTDAPALRWAPAGIVWRTALIGVLAFAAAWLMMGTRLYATATLALLIAALFAADVARLIRRVVWVGRREIDDRESIDHQRQIEHLQSLLDTVAVALVVIQPDGRIALANRAARRLAARPVERLEDIRAIGSDAARALLSRAPGSRSVVPLADGGRAFASVSRFTSPAREPQRLLAIQRIAGELDAVEIEAWREMAHVLAHEMMNSLTPIVSLSESLEGLLRSVAPEAARDTADGDADCDDPRGGAAPRSAEAIGALEAIRRRSSGLIDFVERYRAVAELPRPRPRRLQLDQLLDGVGRLLSAKLAERGISYRTSVVPPDLTVCADPQLLEQAIINLLRNASDAVLGVVRPSIEVSCRALDGQVHIEIADNGCGVPEARRDRIFVPFFTTKAGGSGIGLNLARQIALSHGGRLELRANAPAGSVFALVLPQSTASSSPQAPAPEARGSHS